MQKSESIKNIAVALAKFQEEISTVKKDSKNPFFHSKYASLETIVSTIRKPLADSGLSFSQFPTGENELTTILMHTSGEYLQSTVKMTPKDATPQGQGSAITYMRRYALSGILGIVTEEDDDGNTASVPFESPKTPRNSIPAQPGVSKSSTTSVPKTPKAKKAEQPPKTEPSDADKIAKIKLSIHTSLLKMYPDVSAENVKEIVKKATGLELVEENYKEIDSRLMIRLSEGEWDNAHKKDIMNDGETGLDR